MIRYAYVVMSRVTCSLLFSVSVFFPDIIDMFPNLLAFKLASKDMFDFFNDAVKQIFEERKKGSAVRHC